MQPAETEEAGGFDADGRPSLPIRKGSAFSIHSVTAGVASIAAAAAHHRERPRAYTMPTDREMTEVTSRPESVHDDITEESDEDSDVEESVPTQHLGVSGNEGHTRTRAHSSGAKLESEKSDRMSISDRFANMSVLGKLGGGGSVDRSAPSPSLESSNIVSKEGSLSSGVLFPANGSLIIRSPTYSGSREEGRRKCNAAARS
jgi:hypothetical protein